MLNKSFICLTFFLGFGYANAEPLSGTIIGNVSKDILNYECTRIGNDPNRIQCDFVQVLFSKVAKPDGLEKYLTSMRSQIEEADIDELKTIMCNLSDYLEAILANDRHAVFDEISPEDYLKAIEDHIASDPRAKSDTVQFAINAKAVCANPTSETLETYFRNAHEKNTRTCTYFVNKYSQTYLQLSDTLWAVESTPSGICGVVNTSKFIGSKEHGILWEHETSKVIMKKEGEDLLKCSDLDESKTLYSWKGGPHFLGCDYIK